MTRSRARGLAAGPAEEAGRWEVLPYGSQIEAVHLVLLRTGKVLYYSGFRLQEAVPTETRLWDPETGHIRSPRTPADIFCAGHAFLPDGRLFSTGGTLEYRNMPRIPPWLVRLLRPVSPLIIRLFGRRRSPPLLTGLRSLYLFDPATEEWAFGGDMPEGRWYPTTTALPDGRLLIISGRDGAGGIGSEQEAKVNRLMELYDAVEGLRPVGTIPEEDAHHGEERHHGFPSLYPRLHVLPLSEAETSRHPEGRVFCSGYGPETRMLDLATWTWTEVGDLNFAPRHDGCCVLLPLRPPDYRARVLTCGGSTEETGLGARATGTAELIDFGDAQPSWRWVDPMQGERTNATATVLFDGSVLVAGGNSTGLFDDPVHAVDLFDPETASWRPVAPIRVGRGYHATAILLPDGRVLLSGTTPFGKYELRMEVYSPPYLFRGPRPAVIAAPASVAYGAGFEVGYRASGPIRAAVLIRPGAMTHAFDMEQRYVVLESSTAGEGRLSVRAPPDGHVAPPGHYMLVLLAEGDIPSEAVFVRLSS